MPKASPDPTRNGMKKQKKGAAKRAPLSQPMLGVYRTMWLAAPIISWLL